MRAFEYIDAISVEDAISLLQTEKDSKIIAGGIDLLVLMKNRLANPPLLINLKTISGLDRVEGDGKGGTIIGSLVTLTALGENQIVQRSLPILTEAIRVAASPQLRNVATIGGNLCQKPRCWYYHESFDCFLNGGKSCLTSNGQNRDAGIFGGAECYAVNPSDLAPALVALDASIVIQDAKGRRQIPLSDFFTVPKKDFLSQNILGHEEVIVEIRIPKQLEDSRGTYLKAMGRKAWSFAQASVAIQLSRDNAEINDVRIVLGAVAPIPWRAKGAEDILRGKAPTTELIGAAAAAAVQDANTAGSKSYKVMLVKELVRRGLAELLGVS